LVLLMTPPPPLSKDKRQRIMIKKSNKDGKKIKDIFGGEAMKK